MFCTRCPTTRIGPSTIHSAPAGAIPAGQASTPDVRAEATRPRIYFAGFSALRFVAALAVIVYHIEIGKRMTGAGGWSDYPFFGHLGAQAVTFFFVLSGFLISYLLMQERERAGTVDVRRFYIRRILRIWPLYYTVVAIAFFAMPAMRIFEGTTFQVGSFEDTWHVLALTLAMLPNLALAFGQDHLFSGFLWSIGVEEQFYLFWPWIFKKSPGRAATLRALGYTLGIVVAIHVFSVLGSHYLPADAWPGRAARLLYKIRTFNRFESMAIGGLMAWMLFYGAVPAWLARLLRPAGTLAVGGTVLLLMYAGIHLPFVDTYLYSTLYGIILLGFSLHPQAWGWLESRLLIHLGNISYGLYMLNILVVWSLFAYASKLGYLTKMDLLTNLGLYAVGIGGTVGLASLSYYLLEMPFLKLKDRFAIVRSGGKVG